MSTALAARPAPGTQPPGTTAPTAPRARRGLLRRVGGLRHTSPGRLQLLLAMLLTLGLLTGLVAGLTGSSAAAGTTDLGDRAQPLLVEAETIYAALADADTTAAQAFLAGGLEPAALTRRYDDDLDRASTALTSAARRAPEGSRAADAIGALSTGLARYAALVATARADNRQGLPVGSSYLSAASDLNRTELLPQAQALFRIAQSEVAAGYRSAASAGWVALFAVLTVLLLAALLLIQRYLSRATRRTFNVPLLAATVLTVLFVLGATIVLSRQNAHLDRAEDTGSAPTAQIAEARIQALRERGDEALTLAAHGSRPDYEEDFAAATKALTPTLVNRYLGRPAISAHEAYLAQHKNVRRLDDNGDYDGAVQAAIGPQTTQVFEAFTSDLGTALEGRKAAFTDEIGRAGRGLGLLTVLGPLVALAVCLLAYAGIRARLEEYR